MAAPSAARCGSSARRAFRRGARPDRRRGADLRRSRPATFPGWRPTSDSGWSRAPAPRSAFPASGPYDQRLGYSEMPAFLDRLRARGYGIEAQARTSRELAELMDAGYFPPYPEKSQAGLAILDCGGELLFRASHPARVYAGLQCHSAARAQHAALHREPRAAGDRASAAQSGRGMGASEQGGRSSAASRSSTRTTTRRAAARWRPRSRSTATPPAASPRRSRRSSAR